MRLLLDTQVWLWMQAEPDKLSPQATDLISDTRNEVLLSAASSWEIAIKFGSGRLPLPTDPHDYVSSRMARSGTTGLPVHHHHALHVATLPTHHRDPFDRLLISQAMLEGALLISADRQMAAYEVQLLLS